MFLFLSTLPPPPLFLFFLIFSVAFCNDYRNSLRDKEIEVISLSWIVDNHISLIAVTIVRMSLTMRTDTIKAWAVSRQPGPDTCRRDPCRTFRRLRLTRKRSPAPRLR